MVNFKAGPIGPQVRETDSKHSWRLPVAVFMVWSNLQIATQFAAYAFSYHADLGRNLGGLYPPWQVLVWASRWYEQNPATFTTAASVAIGMVALELLVILWGLSLSASSAKPSLYLHGSARWAQKADIQAAGLIRRDAAKSAPAEASVYVGGWQDEKGTFHYLRHSGPEHVLTYAPTRSGKGVGLVIPTLLSWRASVVATDLKAELWALTAGWRQKHAGNKVMRFEPAASGSVAWNPLAEIRLGTDNEVGDTQNLATLVVCPDGGAMETHWQKTSFSLLVGVILHALYKARDAGSVATLPSVDAMLSDPKKGAKALWQEMVANKHLGDEPHWVVAAAGRDMLDRPEEEAGSVLSTAKSYLSLYRDPIVARNVSGSDFRIKDLMHDDAPVSLYIVTQPNDKDRLRPLVRVLINMVVRILADKLQFRDGRPIANYKNRLLMMLDEFPALGRLSIIQESLAYLGGFGIKCFLICQDTAQLRSQEGYGPDESITSCCHVQNAFPPNRIETAEHLSRQTGIATAIKEQVTTSGRRGAAFMGQASRVFNEVQRPLLTPDECMRMPGPRKSATGEIEEPGDMVVCVTGFPAIYGKQPLYFKDPTFAARARVPAPRESDTIERPSAQETRIQI